MKKFWRFFAILVACTLTLSGCSDDELALEAKMIENTLENTEWRAKMNTEYYVDKKTHYKVLKFLPNRRFRFGDADSGGMIYRIRNTGFYRIDAAKKIIFPDGMDGISYYIYPDGELTLRGEAYDFKQQ